MRIKNFLAGVLPALAMCVSVSTPANAQSFFQTLFGFSKPAPQTRAVRPSQSVKRQRLGDGNARLPAGDYQLAQQARSYRRGYVSGNYRTICVRTCDGFYFPISSAASYGRFHKDARTCKSRCGGGAELFYLPRRSDNIKGARSLSGRSYADLENAFRYRKTLVNGCACRPMPWSSAERARHRRYEYVAAVQKSYALAEARAKKRREDFEAARVAKKKADANAKAIALAEAKAQAEAEEKALAQPVVFDDSDDFQTRWVEASTKFAAPYYALGRGPRIAVTLGSGQVEGVQAGPASIQTGDMATTEDDTTSHANSFVPSQTTSRPASRKTARFGHSVRKKKPRARGPVRRSKSAKKKKKNANVAFKGFFGNKKPKYSWPGD